MYSKERNICVERRTVQTSEDGRSVYGGSWERREKDKDPGGGNKERTNETIPPKAINSKTEKQLNRVDF